MRFRLPSALLCGLLVCGFGFCPVAQLSAQWEQVLKELFPPSVPRAIERGLAPEGNLLQELRAIDDEEITTRRQAQALVRLAKALPLPATLSPAPAFSAQDLDLYSQITSIYQNVFEDTAAYTIVQDQAVPELLRLYDTLATRPSSTVTERETLDLAMVHLLKLFAMYRTSEGTDRVIAAIEAGLAGDAWSWHEVLAYYDYEHPEAKRVYQVVRTNLPELPLGLVVLSAANNRASEENTFTHPFDHAAGVERLKSWLGLLSPDECFTIVDAIPLLNAAHQPELYAAVARINDADLRLHCAEVKARNDEEEGAKELAELCLDPKRSSRARNMLEDLGKESLIPAAALRRPFVIEAQIYGWLADNQWSYDYDNSVRVTEVKVVENYKLKSSGDQSVEFSLVEFNLVDEDPLTLDQHGLCIYGDDPQCFINTTENYLSREDLIAAVSFSKTVGQNTQWGPIAAEELELLRKQWTGAELVIESESALTVTFDAEFNYPQASVVCAPATLNEQAGFVVLDGARTLFYPADRFHSNTRTYDIRNIHCGRVLSGLAVDIERPVLKVEPEKLPSEQIVQQCEVWLEELTSATEARKSQLLQFDSLLLKHLASYIQAVTEIKPIERSQNIVQTIDRILDAQASLPDELRKKVDGLTYISELLLEYALAPELDPARAQLRWQQLEYLAQESYHVPWLGRLILRAGNPTEAIKLLETHLIADGETDQEVLDVLTDALKADGQVQRALQLNIQAYQEQIRYAAELSSLEDSPWLRQLAEDQLTLMREKFPDQIDAALAQANIATDFEQAIKDYRQNRSSRRQKK